MRSESDMCPKNFQLVASLDLGYEKKKKELKKRKWRES